MNLRPFKLDRVYLDTLNLSNVGYFSRSWIVKEFILVQKRKKNSSSYVYVLHKSSHLEVSRQRNVLKSVMHVQSCFAHRTNCFLILSLLSSCLRKLPDVGRVLSLWCCTFLYAIHSTHDYSHSTGRIFDWQKNLTGNFVHAEPFNIIARFTRTLISQTFKFSCG